MNIAVQTSDRKYIVRPDTTRAHEGDDFYAPEDVASWTYTPVLYARISKAGRSIGRQFASRYYDGICYGFFLYPEDYIDGSETGFACASCIDHTSFLPLIVYNPLTLGSEDNEFVLERDGQRLFSTSTLDAAEIIEDAITGASQRIYLRIGDLVAIELSPRSPIASKGDGSVHVKGTFCDNELMDIDLIV